MAFDPPIERAQRWDVLIQQGSTFERTLEAVGVDLTGMALRGQIRRSHGDPQILAAYTITLTPPRTFKVELAATVSATLPAGRLVHDIEAYVQATGFVARLLEGRAIVTPEVTR